VERGTADLTHSTVSGNRATYAGGGLDNAGLLPLTQSTVSDNRTTRGKGLYNSCFAFVRRSIIAGNTVALGGTGPDCREATLSG